MTLLLIAAFGGQLLPRDNAEKVSFNYNSNLQPSSDNWDISLDLSGLYFAEKLCANHLRAVSAELCRGRMRNFSFLFSLAVPVKNIALTGHSMGCSPKTQVTIGSKLLRTSETDV